MFCKVQWKDFLEPKFKNTRAHFFDPEMKRKTSREVGTKNDLSVYSQMSHLRDMAKTSVSNRAPAIGERWIFGITLRRFFYRGNVTPLYRNLRLGDRLSMIPTLADRLNR